MRNPFPIRKLFLALILSVCFGGISTSFAQVTTQVYQGNWNGSPCSVTIHWADYDGLGTVSGQISIVGQSNAYAFTGKNPRKGHLEITVPGDPVYKFDKSLSGTTVTWTLVPGGGVSFSRNSGSPGSGLPGGGLPGNGLPQSGLPGAGIPKPAKRDPKTTIYSGSWGGSVISTTIHWDDYAGQGPVEGHIHYQGHSYPFQGSNPKKGEMKINITGVGVYQLRKSGSGSKATWSGKLNGTLLTFGRSTKSSGLPPGGAVSTPPSTSGSTLWLIACQADRDKISADKNAAEWRQKGFSGAGVVHKSQYRSLDGDQNWWITYAASGSKSAMQTLLPRVKSHYASAYGIKADQSGKREVSD